MMSAEANKFVMQAIFKSLAVGNGQLFVEAMRDFSWTISGHGPWARPWRGKTSVRNDLFRPLFSQFATTYQNMAERFIAEGEFVVVECKGDVETKAGKRYDNYYCYVCKFADDGELLALTEYMDTERVFDAPV